MPTGIVMQSGSQGATEKDIEKVLVANNYEVDKPEVKEETEPTREQFDSDESWEAAKADFEAKQEEREEEEERKAEEAEERKPTKKLSRRERAVQLATKDLRDELRKANERLAALEGKTETKVSEPKAPKREDFKSDQEFDDAMFDYRYQLRRAKEQADEAKKSLESRVKANFEEYKESVAAFMEEHDDWKKVVDKNTILPQPVYYAIVDLGKDGPAVTYYLGQHPEVIDELAEMTPYRAAIEVGRLADKLNKSAEKKTSTKPNVKIPEPVKPVTTSATTSTLTSSEAAAKRDYRAFKAAQRKGA